MTRSRTKHNSNEEEVSSNDLDRELLSGWSPGKNFLDACSSVPELRLEDAFRDQHRYELLWGKVCLLYEGDERDLVIETLKDVKDLPQFIWWLLEYGTTPKGTSKAGGEARNAQYQPLKNRARRIFLEKKQEHEINRKTYSQAQFAKWFRESLKGKYEDDVLRKDELQKRYREVSNEISLGELDASQRRQLLSKKRELQEKLRVICPILPSDKIIREWLSGL